MKENEIKINVVVDVRYSDLIALGFGWQLCVKVKEILDQYSVVKVIKKYFYNRSNSQERPLLQFH